MVSSVNGGATERSVALRPGAVPFRILTMKGLYLRSVLYSRYYYNLTCEASWVVETGASSTQDKSRIVNTILPFIMKNCTEEDKAVLTSAKPDSASPEYDTWNTNLLKKTAEIESRLEAILEKEELTYFPLRDMKKLRRKHMSVNGVEGRLTELRKMSRDHAIPTTSAFCTPSDVTCSSASSKSLPSKSTTHPPKEKSKVNSKKQPTIIGAFHRK